VTAKKKQAYRKDSGKASGLTQFLRDAYHWLNVIHNVKRRTILVYSKGSHKLDIATATGIQTLLDSCYTSQYDKFEGNLTITY